MEAILLSALALLGALLWAPLRLGARVSARWLDNPSPSGLQIHVLVGWAAGPLLRLPVPVQPWIRARRLLARPPWRRRHLEDQPGSISGGGRRPSAAALAVNMKSFADALGKLPSYVRALDRLEWRIRVGSGDAAVTSLSAGLLWSLMGGVAAAVQSRVPSRLTPRLAVIPDFEKPAASTQLTCIFHVRLGEIILAVLHDAARRWGAQRGG